MLPTWIAVAKVYWELAEAHPSGIPCEDDEGRHAILRLMRDMNLLYEYKSKDPEGAEKKEWRIGSFGTLIGMTVQSCKGEHEEFFKHTLSASIPHLLGKALCSTHKQDTGMALAPVPMMSQKEH